MATELVDIAKILVPALGAWGAAWLANRKERATWMAKQEAEQRSQLDNQASRMTAGWEMMTTQAREIIARLQVETIDAKTRAAVAEEKAMRAEERGVRLERELEEVRGRYDAAMREIGSLRDARTRGPGGVS